MKIRLLVDDVDFTNYILEDWNIVANDGTEISVLECTLFDETLGLSISTGQDIVVEDYNDDTVRQFGGVVVEIHYEREGLGRLLTITAQDYKMLLDRATFSKSFYSMTDIEIIRDAFIEARLTEVDTSNLTATPQDLQALNFRGSTLLNMFQVLSSITGKLWNVDFFKRLEYRNPKEAFASFALTDEDIVNHTVFEEYYNWRYTEEMGLYNEVEVRGAVQVSNDRTDTYSGDGVSTEYTLGSQANTIALSEQPSDSNRVEVWINTGTDAVPIWTEQGVGIAEQDILGGTIDVVFSPLARSMRFSDAPPAFTNSWRVRGRYYDPIIAVVSDDARKVAWNRTFKKVIMEPDITELSAAEDIAEAFLEEHGTVFYAKCTIDRDGLKPGQSIAVTNEIAGLDTVSFLIQSIDYGLLGGELAEYQLTMVNQDA